MTLWKYQNRRKFDRATGRTVVALHRISIVRFVTLQSNACNRPRAAGRCAIQFQLVKRHQAKLSDRYSASKLEPSLPQAGQNSPLLSFLHFGLSFCPNTPKRPLNWCHLFFPTKHWLGPSTVQRADFHSHPIRCTILRHGARIRCAQQQ